MNENDHNTLGRECGGGTGGDSNWATEVFKTLMALQRERRPSIFMFTCVCVEMSCVSVQLCVCVSVRSGSSSREASLL